MEAQDLCFRHSNEIAEKYDIRRYGAHGTSHKYLSEEGLKYCLVLNTHESFLATSEAGPQSPPLRMANVSLLQWVNSSWRHMMCTRTGHWIQVSLILSHL